MQRWKQPQQSSEYAAATTTVLRNGTIPVFDDGMLFIWHSPIAAAAWTAAAAATAADGASSSSALDLASAVSSDAPAAWAALISSGWR